MDRDSATPFVDLFLILFIAALLAISPRTPSELEPLRQPTPGVRVTSADPAFPTIKVTDRIIIDEIAVSDIPTALGLLKDRPVSGAMLRGDASTDYALYEALEQALQQAGLRVIRIGGEGGRS